MWYDAIVNKIKKFNTKVKVVEIKANTEDINNIVGHKKENIEKLRENYDVELEIKIDNNIKHGKFELKVEKTYDDLLEEIRK